MDKKIKVCVLGTRGFPDVQGGVEKHCENLYPRLARLGCDVTVFTRPDYVDAGKNEYDGVRLVPLKTPKSKFFEAFVHTGRGILSARLSGCDLVHIHAIGPSFFAPFARLMGLKVITTNHGPDYDRQKWGKTAKFFLKTGENLGTRCSHEVISISKTISDHLNKKYKKNPVLIPNGVLVPTPASGEAFLKKFGLQKGKYVLAVGRFVPEKGFHDLVSAFNTLRTDWKLLIIGEADHADAYTRELKIKAALNKNIVLGGFQKGETLKEIYSHAGIFVLPSYHEGLPIVLLEAMSFGLSCILSDIPANTEVGLEKERYFRAGDIAGLANKIKIYIERGVLSETEKSFLFDMIRERYNWDKIAEKTMKVYRTVVDRRKK